MTDGHKLVISHQSQKQTIQTTKKHKERHLSQAALIGDGSAVSLNICSHLWDCGGGEIYVSQGQDGEEEVHGGVEMGVRADSQDDKQVPKHCDQVHGQEQAKEDGLKIWIL
jgi:hypothetical protein